MGVEGFYGVWIKGKYYYVIENGLPNDEYVSRNNIGDIPNIKVPPGSNHLSTLFMDLNGLIHPVAQEFYSYGDKYREGKRRQVESALREEGGARKMQEGLFREIGKEIIKIIDRGLEQVGTRKAIDCLILCVDGVAPFIKISQQRTRRFKASIKDEGKPANPGDHPPEQWNPACITPGTSFMEELNKYLAQFIVSLELDEKVIKSIIYSSSRARGEGEHKVFEFLRKDIVPEMEEGGFLAIHGLDADLIMLSMLCPIQRIFIIRDSFNKKEGTDEHRVLDLGVLRKSILKDMSGYTDPTSSAYAHFCRDFVLLTNFVGNDFLRKLWCFSDMDTSMQGLISDYRDKVVINEHGIEQIPLVFEEGVINWNLFIDILASCAEREKEHFTKRSREIGQEIRELKRDISKEDSESSTLSENREKLRILESSGVEGTFEEFRTFWYNKFLGPRAPVIQKQKKRDRTVISRTKTVDKKAVRSNVEAYLRDKNGKEAPFFTPEDIRMVCRKYLLGLQYVCNYYINGISSLSSTYAYQWTQSPLACDILETLKYLLNSGDEPILSEVKYNSREPKFNVVQQLVAVLPQESAYLIPDTFGDMLTDFSAIGDVCPLTFQVDSTMTSFGRGHQNIPILPILSPLRVADRVRAVVPGNYEELKPYINSSLRPIAAKRKRFERVVTSKGDFSERGGFRGRGTRGGFRGESSGRGTFRGRGNSSERGESSGRGNSSERGESSGRGNSSGRGSRRLTSENVM